MSCPFQYESITFIATLQSYNCHYNPTIVIPIRLLFGGEESGEGNIFNLKMILQRKIEYPSFNYTNFIEGFKPFMQNSP